MIERFGLTPDFSISRMIKGGWQLSEGHSTGLMSDPVGDMTAFVRAGITTFDCADIYTGVEEVIGKYLRHHKSSGGRLNEVQVLTKFVPDYDALAGLTKAYVVKVIDRSLQRLGLDRLDMVQFSWWSYDIEGWLEAAHWLDELREEGKIRYVSATNFNTKCTRDILSSGVSLKTLQIQYSLLDNRPEKELTKLCLEHGPRMLCYGTVGGGFLSEYWLGKAEPAAPFANRSLVKYKLIIDDFGGWDLFQELLIVLKGIGDRHNVGIANVAMRYILDQPAVAGIIVGARTAAHLDENLKTFSFALDPSDLSAIRNVLSRRKGPEGDVFDLERVKEGPHGRIMRYNLNRVEL
ncbi:MAG: aldo/keto reductase [Bacteroidetes bacterium]|nr:aldo/keto reductase [Bacteroidota bacterium]